MQTARWWASRIEPDEHGRGHIRGVIGPDEYHEHVDDNAYTNVMARWNLRRAADAGGGVVDEAERRRWLELADAIVDGYDPATGIYEQFAGFHALEPLLIAEIAPRRPVSADMLLGARPHPRRPGRQAGRRADAALPRPRRGRTRARWSPTSTSTSRAPPTAARSPRACTQRCSPAPVASPRPLEMLRLTARIDLDDIGHMTAGGLHLAAMGSVWRTLAFGFAGLRPVGRRARDRPRARARLGGARTAGSGSVAARVRVRVHPDVGAGERRPAHQCT